MERTVKNQGPHMLPDEVQSDIISRVVIYGAGIPTLAMGWLNANSSGIQAACTILVTMTVIYRAYIDWRKGRAKRDV